MTTDAIYYLASTVAQTIASLAGFLGAFVLFHLQARDGALMEHGLRISAGAQVVAPGLDEGLISFASYLR